MSELPLSELGRFIVKAKAATYVGNGQKALAHRTGSHDLEFHAEPFSYLDSYFGGADFLGQEVAYFEQQPVWVMNYYGYILKSDRITAQIAGQVIKASLSKLYEAGRFLGGFEFTAGDYSYTDTNEGDFTHFTGKEYITHQGIRVYELIYHGGLVKN